jgi:hypothetical protein
VERKKIYWRFLKKSRLKMEIKKLLRVADVRKRMNAYYREEISYTRAVELLNEDANKALNTASTEPSRLQKRIENYREHQEPKRHPKALPQVKCEILRTNFN